MKWLLAVAIVAAAALASWNVLYPYAFNHHARVRQLVWQASRTMHVDPWLLTAVIESESHFQPNAVSNRGAVGLMQIEPSTGLWVEARAHIRGPVGSPRTNILIGAWYLRYLQDTFHGSILLALAAYNGGPARVRQWVHNGDMRPQDGTARIPFGETRYFVRRVLGDYHRYLWISQHSLVIGRPQTGHASSGEVTALGKILSEDTKQKLGQRMGVDDIVRKEGWGGVSARQCGLLVKEALKYAEQQLKS